MAGCLDTQIRRLAHQDAHQRPGAGLEVPAHCALADARVLGDFLDGDRLSLHRSAPRLLQSGSPGRATPGRRLNPRPRPVPHVSSGHPSRTSGSRRAPSATQTPPYEW
jgi:hypothetical protein